MPSTLFTRRLATGLVGLLATSVAVSAPSAWASPGPGGSGPLSIQYSDCTEYIGFEWVPRSAVAARSLTISLSRRRRHRP